MRTTYAAADAAQRARTARGYPGTIGIPGLYFFKCLSFAAVEETIRKHLLIATALSLLVAGPAWAASTAASGDPQSIAGTTVAQTQTSRPRGAMMSEQKLAS
jgi:hypothetical protein